MIVLGITDSFTSGAAVVIDGKVVAAVNEERLNRSKMCMGFPELSILEVLKIAKVRSHELDAVAVATENLFWKPEAVPYTDYFRKKRGSTREFYLSLGGTFSTLVGDSDAARKAYYRIKKLLTRGRREKIKKKLRDAFGIQKPIKFLDHHLCHAASAYFTSGFEDATIVTQDGAGDGKCSRVYQVRKGYFNQLQMLDSYHSVGNYYSYVTHLCGYKAHKHEGKITGLAAFGNASYINLLRNYVSYENGKILNTGKCFDHKALYKLKKELPADFSHSDLSASIQVLLEETVSNYCEYWIKRSGIPYVALAGGVFANVKLNQRINELNSTKQVFIHPGMGDDGLSVGAALFEENRLSGYQPKSVIRDVYLGGDYCDTEIEKALKEYGDTPVQFEGILESKIASLLADGKVVARFDGRMEYGPRALGNRTILYQATDPTVNDWLNRRLVRTEFMPFAPVTLWEERHNCYNNVEGAEDTARFMTITFDCTEFMKESCPAVVHVDGTARPQLIRKEDNASYYNILKEYQKITGLPSLINTSFNMHEEPIVNSPKEAIQSFKNGHLDYLAIGKYLVKNEKSL